MILTLDVGNSQIFGGVFADERLRLQFRKSSKYGTSSDELGLFLKSVLIENNLDPKLVQEISLCSAVPDMIHSLRGACLKYFGLDPFILQAGVKTGLKIKYRNPIEVGADRIANSVGALAKFPGQNLVIVDFGTATTFCVVTKDRDYLGGLILPGLRLAMESLESGTAKLPKVEILNPKALVGRSTIENIQSGLFNGNLEMVRGLSTRLRREALNDERALIIGTGGFSRLFESEKLFDVLVPDLVLYGLLKALQMNQFERNHTHEPNDAQI
jgi:type III pantothenate kinase